MKKFFTFIAVAGMALAAQANVLTVADPASVDDAWYSGYSPVCGLYCDTYGTQVQLIYSADMLAEMAGNQITQVRFYTLNDFYENNGYGASTDVTDYINFENAKIQLSLKEVDEAGFTEVAAITGATIVATTVPVKGDTYLTFELDEPFTYNGGNLMVETLVIEEGSWGATYFIGSSTDPVMCGYYDIAGEADLSSFMPKTSFTYEAGTTPVEPTELTAAPTFNGYTTDGIHAYFVEIVPTEPSVIYYRVQYQEGEFTDWAVYEDILSFTGDGKYRIEAYAVADGKLPSYEIAYEFVVSPATGLSEMNADKAVAGVRYFNMAGQEMTEANGMTIVVTTFTDGTTSTVKVVK